MKNRKHIFIPLFIFIGACVISLIASIVDYTLINPTKSYSSSTIQLLYDGASNGVDPDGNKYDPKDFLTDEVIQKGLKETGLENKYSVEEIRNHISLEGVVPSSVISDITSFTSLINGEGGTRELTDKDYNPTKYSIKLYNDLETKLNRSKSNELLNNIVNSYVDYFESYYRNDFELSKYDDILSIDDLDYIYQIETYQTRLDIVRRYSVSLYNKHTDFVNDGKSFNDIILKCDALTNDDISKMKYSINLYALSTEIETLKNDYTYQILELNYSKNKYTVDLANINTQIESYQKDQTIYIGSGDNVIKVEGNSKATYDKLLNEKIDISNRIAECDNKISDLESKLNDLNNNAASNDEVTKLKSQIKSLGEEVSKLEASFTNLKDAYNNKYLANSTLKVEESKFVSASIFSLGFIVHTIKLGLPLVLAVMIGIAIYFMVRYLKKQRNSK